MQEYTTRSRLSRHSERTAEINPMIGTEPRKFLRQSDAYECHLLGYTDLLSVAGTSYRRSSAVQPLLDRLPHIRTLSVHGRSLPEKVAYNSCVVSEGYTSTKHRESSPIKWIVFSDALRKCNQTSLKEYENPFCISI